MVMFRSGYPSAPPPPDVSPSEPPEHAATTSETATRRTSRLVAPISLACRMQPTSLSPSAHDGREIWACSELPISMAPEHIHQPPGLTTAAFALLSRSATASHRCHRRRHEPRRGRAWGGQESVSPDARTSWAHSVGARKRRELEESSRHDASILFWVISATMLLRPRSAVRWSTSGNRPMRAGGDMGPVVRRRTARVAEVQQVVERPVTGDDGTDRRVRARGPPSSPSDPAVRRMVDHCPWLAA